MLTEILDKLVAGGHLLREEMQFALQAIMTGQCQDAEIACFLTALRCKGETAEEIAAAVEVLREHMVRLDTGGLEVLDTCGAGGDGQGTFNISTTAALIVAGCGVPVVKHGNRAVSSVSGSADVLAALGVKIDCEPQIVLRCLHEAGIGFCFAPRFHPAMKHVAGVRKQLGFRTIFNLLGPLLNPAGAKRQLIGVGRMELLDTLANALVRLGTKNAILVCGRDGLDEVTLSGPTSVRAVRTTGVQTMAYEPADFGLEVCSASNLKVKSVAESSGIVRSVLDGQQGPHMNIALANAAAALTAGEKAAALKEGVQLAREAIASGKAARALQRLVEVSNSEE